VNSFGAADVHRCGMLANDQFSTPREESVPIRITYISAGEGSLVGKIASHHRLELENDMEHVLYLGPFPTGPPSTINIRHWRRPRDRLAPCPPSVGQMQYNTWIGFKQWHRLQLMQTRSVATNLESLDTLLSDCDMVGYNVLAFVHSSSVWGTTS
jgi:hypothetical protein